MGQNPLKDEIGRLFQEYKERMKQNRELAVYDNHEIKSGDEYSDHQMKLGAASASFHFLQYADIDATSLYGKIIEALEKAEIEKVGGGNPTSSSEPLTGGKKLNKLAPMSTNPKDLSIVGGL